MRLVKSKNTNGPVFKIEILKTGNLCSIVHNMKQKWGASFFLVVIMLFGFCIRSIGLPYGLPQQFIGDEFVQVAVALKMLDTGSFTPNFPDIFYHQPLSAYISLFGIGGFLVFQLLRGTFTNIEALRDYYAVHASELLLVPRFLSVLLGIGALVLLYLAVKELFSKRIGILTALFGAVNFTLSYTAHSGRVWGYMPFFIALALFACVKLFYNDRTRNYVAVMGATLLAAANLLPGIFTLAPAFVSRFSFKNKKMWWTLAGTTVGVIIIFFMNPRGLGALLFRFQSLSGGALIESVTGSAISYKVPTPSILRRIFDPFTTLVNYDLFITLFGIIGARLLLRENRKKFLFLASFPIVYYLFIGPFFTFGWVVRTLVPLALYFSIFAAYAVARIVELKFKNNSKIYAIFAGIVLLPSLIMSVWFDIKIVRDDTRTQAISWIYSNLPENSRILVYSLTNEVINQNKEVLEVMKAIFPEELNTRQKTLLESREEEYPRPVYFAWDLRDIPPERLPDGFLKENNFTYYVRTDWNNEVERVFNESFNNLLTKKKLITTFSPFETPEFDRHDILSAHNMMYPFRALLRAKRFGPVVEIYEVDFK